MQHSSGPSLLDPRRLPPPPVGYDSWRFGPAFLRPATEKDHFELMRPIFVLRNEGDRTVEEFYEHPVGPLAVYRVKGRGDRTDPTHQTFSGPPLEMKTMDSKGRPIELILVWWPGMEGQGNEAP